LFCTGLNPERILGRPTTRESTEDTLGMVSMKPLVGQHARHVLFDPSILFHMGVTHALLPIFSRRCEKSGSWLSRRQQNMTTVEVFVGYLERCTLSKVTLLMPAVVAVLR